MSFSIPHWENIWHIKANLVYYNDDTIFLLQILYDYRLDFSHSVANLYSFPRINLAVEALLKLHILWKEIKGVGDIANKNGLKHIYSFNYLLHELSEVAFGSSVPPIVKKRASVFEDFLFLSIGKQSILLSFSR